jgi:hypothetical protein
MLKNSYSKFKEKFDMRKLGSFLQDQTLTPLNEDKLDLDPILPLLD